MIQTRQNSKGNWWCNGTIAGFGDISFEGSSPVEAQVLMREWMVEKNIPDIEWDIPKMYPQRFMNTDEMEGWLGDAIFEQSLGDAVERCAPVVQGYMMSRLAEYTEWLKGTYLENIETDRLVNAFLSDK